MKTNQFLQTLLGTFLLVIFMTQMAFAERKYRVKATDNLNSIVVNKYAKRSFKKAQIMVAILARNPDAFLGGNLNFLLKGKRIYLPDESEMEVVSYDDAKEILADHAAFYRLGITGAEEQVFPIFDEKPVSDSTPEAVPVKAPEVTPAPVKTVKATSKTSSISKSQRKKIAKLEKESRALKKRLELLFKEKKNRDKKLVELEKSVKASLQKSDSDKEKVTKSLSKIEEDYKKLKEEKNAILKKLEASQNALTKNTRSDTAPEEELNGLKKQASQIAPKMTEEAPVSTPIPAPAISVESTPTDGANTSVNNSSTSFISSIASLGKAIWLLPLLLILGLLWYLLKGRRSSSYDNENYAEKIAQAEADLNSMHVKAED